MRMLSRRPNRVASTSSKMVPVFQKVSRKRKVRNRFSRGLRKRSSRPKRIAASSHGLDPRAGAVAVKLFAQPGHVDLNHIGRAFPIHLPEVLAKHFASHHLA